MEIDQSCYAKFIDVVNGTEIYIRTIPCIIGRYSHSDDFRAKNSVIGKTIEIDYDNYKDYNLAEYRVHNKLILEKCKRM
jgi:hypothetical protein